MNLRRGGAKKDTHFKEGVRLYFEVNHVNSVLQEIRSLQHYSHGKKFKTTFLSTTFLGVTKWNPGFLPDLLSWS